MVNVQIPTPSLLGRPASNPNSNLRGSPSGIIPGVLFVQVVDSTGMPYVIEGWHGIGAFVTSASCYGLEVHEYA
jgi:hypothetical protein